VCVCIPCARYSRLRAVVGVAAALSSSSLSVVVMMWVINSHFEPVLVEVKMNVSLWGPCVLEEPAVVTVRTHRTCEHEQCTCEHEQCVYV
jgi:hypothetical protein